MLDIRTIREQARKVQETAKLKGIKLDVAELLEADEARRRLMTEMEGLRAERNARSKEVPRLLKDNRIADAEAQKIAVAALLQRLKEGEAKLRIIDAEYERLMLDVPNFVSPETPVGLSDQDNVEVRRTGETVFPFTPLSHVELGHLHQMIDSERGVKVGGARQVVLKNAGLLLHRAVQQLALDLLQEEGFELFDIPVMVKEETLVSSGFFPGNRDQTYSIDGEDKWLAGTAEVPLISLFSGEVLDLAEPRLLAACSPCFRKEVGSAGRDVHGLYRVHQFAKVEQVVICRAELELAEQMLRLITSHAEKLLRLLALPYRVVAVCTGDLSQKNYKQFDIETWMPSRNGYGETHSASLLLDFQARRSRIRYRDEQGNLQFAYTLNNTMVASPRILIPLLENHQQEDGTIVIPEALRPYMKGIDKLLITG
ncbi:serine--tRNA ligase [Paenibacillus sepulcri]